MKSIAFGQYYSADSFVHRMDPRAKVILSILYIVAVFLCKNVFSFGILVLSAIFLVLFSKIPLRMVLGTLKPLVFILTLTSLINLFMTKGEHLLTPENFFLHVYAEGVWNAVFMILRISSLLVATGIFLSFTTTPIDLTDAMEQLLSPLKKIKVPVHDIAMMTTIALRFIPLLMEETEKIMNAQKARGADFQSGGLVKRAKSLLPIFIPLLGSAFKRADELANAMDCRCYHGGEGRTKLKVFRFRISDGVAILFIILFGVGIFFLNRVGIGYSMR